MSQNRAIVALDIGEKRIGVAVASGAVRIAVPLQVVEVDGTEMDTLSRIVSRESAETVVVGYPRNQSGEATAQTSIVERFAKRIETELAVAVVFQDESLTSVQAEEQLKAYGKPYSKGDIDAQAASIILQDYLERNHEE